MVSIQIRISIMMTIILVSSVVRSFVPVPFSRRTWYEHGHNQGSYSLLIVTVSSSLSSSSLSSVTTHYLESLSRQVPDISETTQPPLQQQLLCCKPMAWNGTQISKNAYCVDLPPELLHALRDYATSMGIVDMYRRLLAVPSGGEGAGEGEGAVGGGQPLRPGEEKAVTFQGYHWMVQRPKSHWASNMHWTSPADETAHDDYLRALSAGGFDQVLDLVGRYFHLEALSAYHLSFIGVSQCEKGFIHADVEQSGRKAFNMIIPLILEEEAGPELEILSDDETTTRYYKYKYNVASMVGDNALHATAPCNYQQQQQTTARNSATQKKTGRREEAAEEAEAEDTVVGVRMRLAATIYIGEITPTNVHHLLLSLTQAYPPPGNARHLLERAGNHWHHSNPAIKLPLPKKDDRT